VVLGASSGTGQAIARAVASDPGLDVFGVHRGHHSDGAAELERAVTAAGRRAALRVDDAGTAEGASAGADELLRQAGARSVRFFVHSLANASLGHLALGGDLLSPRQIQKTFDSMAHSFVYWTRALIERDLLAPRARLLALTNPLDESLVARCGLIAATKGALQMYVRVLALELGWLGHRVNLLKFATVVTPAVAKVYGEAELARVEALHRQMIPAGRMCTTAEVGRLVSLLLDERAEWFNGATIDFSGGMTQSLIDLLLVRR
jgi:NAD(P)-dependent dehydrogenase (short-subunit alcohol dehydrogenase family)